ncbi:MAG: DUF1684 domain-containing protein [Bacteroidales bacterium]
MNIRSILAVLLLTLIIPAMADAQPRPDMIRAYTDSIARFRQGKNIRFLYDDASPLTPEQKQNFEGLKYFPARYQYLIKGTFEAYDQPDTVELKTTTDRSPAYVVRGIIRFRFEGKSYSLLAFQNLKLLEINPEDNKLLIPFRDLTAGRETYGGGRYIDCTIPGEGQMIELDFNKAYNPYCAYNPKYSCVLPPPENELPFRVEAGEKVFEENH